VTCVTCIQEAVLQSPDGKYIASGAIDGIINIFDVAYGKVLRTLEGRSKCATILSLKYKMFHPQVNII